LANEAGAKVAGCFACLPGGSCYYYTMCAAIAGKRLYILVSFAQNKCKAAGEPFPSLSKDWRFWRVFYIELLIRTLILVRKWHFFCP